MTTDAAVAMGKSPRGVQIQPLLEGEHVDLSLSLSHSTDEAVDSASSAVLLLHTAPVSEQRINSSDCVGDLSAAKAGEAASVGSAPPRGSFLQAAKNATSSSRNNCSATAANKTTTTTAAAAAARMLMDTTPTATPGTQELVQIIETVTESKQEADAFVAATAAVTATASASGAVPLPPYLHPSLAPANNSSIPSDVDLEVPGNGDAAVAVAVAGDSLLDVYPSSAQLSPLHASSGSSCCFVSACGSISGDVDNDNNNNNNNDDDTSYATAQIGIWAARAGVAHGVWGSAAAGFSSSTTAPGNGMLNPPFPSSSFNMNTTTATNAAVGEGGGGTVTTLVKVQIGPQHFDLLKLIGEGAFGKVILVRNCLDRKIYAMKVLSKKLLKKKNNVTYMKSERDILTKLSHPFIVQLHFAFQTATKLFLVMEFLAGGELFFHLRKRGIILEKDVRFYLAELVLAIEFLHSNGVIHRDLKPENVLLKQDGHVCITDFGLAKEIGDSEKVRTLCGTSEYMAPEMLTRNGYGKAVDWWSLGALCYEMLVGKAPFTANNQKDLDRKILSEKLVTPPYLSAATHALLKGMLERDLTKRLGASKSTMFSIGGVAALKQHAFFSSFSSSTQQPLNGAAGGGRSGARSHPSAQTPVDNTEWWQLVEHKLIDPPFDLFAPYAPAVAAGGGGSASAKNGVASGKNGNLGGGGQSKKIKGSGKPGNVSSPLDKSNGNSCKNSGKSLKLPIKGGGSPAVPSAASSTAVVHAAEFDQRVDSFLFSSANGKGSSNSSCCGEGADNGGSRTSLSKLGGGNNKGGGGVGNAFARFAVDDPPVPNTMFFDEEFTGQPISPSVLEEVLWSGPATPAAAARSRANSDPENINNNSMSNNNINVNNNNNNNNSSSTGNSGGSARRVVVSDENSDYHGFEFSDRLFECTPEQLQEFEAYFQTKVQKALRKKALRTKREEKAAVEESVRKAKEAYELQEKQRQKEERAKREVEAAAARKIAKEKEEQIKIIDAQNVVIRAHNAKVLAHQEAVLKMEKRVKAVKKKLRDVQELEEKVAKGLVDRPSKEQREKLARKALLESELEDVEGECSELLEASPGELQTEVQYLPPSSTTSISTTTASSSSSVVRKGSSRINNSSATGGCGGGAAAVAEGGTGGIGSSGSMKVSTKGAPAPSSSSRTSSFSAAVESVMATAMSYTSLFGGGGGATAAPAPAVDNAGKSAQQQQQQQQEQQKPGESANNWSTSTSKKKKGKKK